MSYIKKYVSFNFKHPQKLGRRNKGKITKYYKFLKGNEHGFFAIKAKRFKTAQKQLNPEFRSIKGRGGIKETEFKVIFVPKNNPPDTTVQFDEEGKAFFQFPYGRQEFIPFSDKERLIYDTKQYVGELVANLPVEARVSVQSATHAFGGSYEPSFIADVIETDFIAPQYDRTSVWLLGLNVTYLENQLA